MLATRLLTMVVGIIGLTLLASVVLIGVLALNGVAIPDVLQNVAVASIAGLLGLLAPSGRATNP
jgi:hypothetical protein